MQIYTADTLQSEDAAISRIKSMPLDETTITHFCTFVDFYTRHCDDPMSASLACEKQMETIEITSQDINQETVQMLLDTMLVVIDHLEKKWLDEQIQHEDRKRRHRQDVAQLHQQVVALRLEDTGKLHFYQKSFQWLHHLLHRKSTLRVASTGKMSHKKRLPRKEAIAW